MANLIRLVRQDLRNLVLIAKGAAVPGEISGDGGADEWGSVVAFLITLKVFDGIDFIKVIGIRTLKGRDARIGNVADRRGFILQRKTSYRLSVLQRTNVEQLGNSSVSQSRSLVLTAAGGLAIPFGRIEIRGKYDILKFVAVTDKATESDISLMWLAFDQVSGTKQSPELEIPIKIVASGKERLASVLSLGLFVLGTLCLFYPDKVLAHLHLASSTTSQDKVKNIALLVMLFASSGLGEVKNKIIDLYKPKA
jgi:hypothetical protein